MVDKEELTLVVTNPISELHSTFDDLFNSANGQRCKFGELFEAWSVPINRCVVKVRTEEFLCLCLSLTDEYLPTESDDGLICATVSVLFKSLAVNIDHLGSVLFIPENIVMEESIAIKCCLFGDLYRPN